MKIVNTDNYGGDYPAEWFLNVHFTRKHRAEVVAEILNLDEGEDASRYWRVVEDDYVLQPGFEP
jgi:hypothetical protein